MRLLVLSDTHGRIEECKDALKGVDKKEIDKFIHLGDFSMDIKDLNEFLDIKWVSVRGNCDVWDKITKEEKIIKINNKKIFLTHGHKYGVKRGLNTIYYRAKELGVDAAFFGHSHIPVSEILDDILFFNPGSISMPRGGSSPSFGIVEVGETIKSNIINI